jgi:hypothetical protein
MQRIACFGFVLVLFGSMHVNAEHEHTSRSVAFAGRSYFCSMIAVSIASDPGPIRRPGRREDARFGRQGQISAGDVVTSTS